MQSRAQARQRVVVLAVVALAGWFAALALAPGSGWAQGEGEPTATRVQLFVPFGPDGLAPGLQVSDRSTFQGNPAVAGGSCQVGSILTTRPDAWRCGTADPCFVDPGRHEPALACATAPWAGRVVLLTVPAPLPEAEQNRFNPATRPPWARELANGTRCVRTGGTATIVEGVGYPYSCQGPDGPGNAGDPGRGAALWTVRQLQGESRTLLPDPVTVLVAWY